MRNNKSLATQEVHASPAERVETVYKSPPPTASTVVAASANHANAMVEAGEKNELPVAEKELNTAPLSASNESKTVAGTEAESLYRDKELAFYSAAIGAWFDTRLEQDKTLISASLAGLAVIGTILSAFGITGWLDLALYGASGLLMIFTAAASYWTMGQSSDILTRSVREEASEKVEKTCGRLEWLARICLTIAVVLFLVGAAVGGVNKMESANSKPPAPTVQLTNTMDERVHMENTKVKRDADELERAIDRLKRDVESAQRDGGRGMPGELEHTGPREQLTTVGVNKLKPAKPGAGSSNPAPESDKKE